MRLGPRGAIFLHQVAKGGPAEALVKVQLNEAESDSSHFKEPGSEAEGQPSVAWEQEWRGEGPSPCPGSETLGWGRRVSLELLA